MADKHPSHVTRFSWDASTYDEVCVNCGATDMVPGGWGELANPCSLPPEKGGMTWEQYLEKDREQIAYLEEEYGKSS